MKKQLSLILVLLLCVTVVGCGKGNGPIGEVDTSSLVLQETLSSDPSMEETLVSETQTESEQPKTEEAVSETEAMTDTESVISSTALSQNEVASVQDEVTSTQNDPTAEEADASVAPNIVAQFSPPPDHLKIHEHTEYTLEAFLEWFNSDAALTEANGAYRQAIEYYRERGELPITFASQKAKWYKLYSTGWLEFCFDGKGIVTIRPFTSSETVAAAKGIVSYFEGEGKTVAANAATADLLSISQSSPERLVECIVSIDSKPTNAVFRVCREDIMWGTTGKIRRTTYTRDLYWIWDGFHVELSFRANDNLNKAIVLDETDEAFFSQLYFENVALTAAPSLVSTPLETE